MKFCDKLIQLRREKGYSQEQLGDILNVSRQSVSKWEADQSMPELVKLIALADIFKVPIDYLVRDEIEEREVNDSLSITNETTEIKEQLDEISKYVKTQRGYEYRSKTKVLGIPLVHIRFAFGRNQLALAKGIIAIGNVSLGVISLGGISLGAFSFGGISLGLLALGGVSIGLVALGAVAIGLLAVGASAIGIYSLGAAAVADKLAVGATAHAEIALGYKAEGMHTLLFDQISSKLEAREFILKHHPNIWKPILELFLKGFK